MQDSRRINATGTPLSSEEQALLRTLIQREGAETFAQRTGLSVVAVLQAASGLGSRRATHVVLRDGLRNAEGTKGLHARPRRESAA